MSKLDNILTIKHPIVTSRRDQWRIMKKEEIKQLFLELIDSIKPYESEDGRAFIPYGELNKKVAEL